MNIFFHFQETVSSSRTFAVNRALRSMAVALRHATSWSSKDWEIPDIVSSSVSCWHFDLRSRSLRLLRIHADRKAPKLMMENQSIVLLKLQTVSCRYIIGI